MIFVAAQESSCTYNLAPQTFLLRKSQHTAFALFALLILIVAATMPRAPGAAARTFSPPPPPPLPRSLPAGSFAFPLLSAFSFIVHGEPGTDGVQGVGFRKAVARFAAARGVTGWARNDAAAGTVEGVAEGAPAALAELRRFVEEEGSPRSVIAGAAFADAEAGAARARPRAWKGFTVAPTTNAARRA